MRTVITKIAKLDGVATWWLVAIAVISIFSTGGCQTTAPVNQPCGVIKDSLRTVQATTAAGNLRLSVHYERGRAAGCWGK